MTLIGVRYSAGCRNWVMNKVREAVGRQQLFDQLSGDTAVLGGRIGWGRGHYDATFAVASPGALRIGLAFECQLIDQVAREPHDIALHILITEVATYVVA